MFHDLPLGDLLYFFFIHGYFFFSFNFPESEILIKLIEKQNRSLS
jgi:hypothetical protein